MKEPRPGSQCLELEMSCRCGWGLKGAGSKMDGWTAARRTHRRPLGEWGTGASYEPTGVCLYPTPQREKESGKEDDGALTQP